MDTWARHVAGAMAAIAVLLSAPPALADEPNPLIPLVDVTAQRLQTADLVAASKWVNGGAIHDPARVEQVLRDISEEARAQNVDVAYAERVFTDQIDANEAIQYSRFAQWQLDSVGAPTTTGDLASVRDTINILDDHMLSEIATHWPALHSPMCAQDLREAHSDVIAARKFDGIYPQALAFAIRSYCG